MYLLFHHELEEYSRERERTTLSWGTDHPSGGPLPVNRSMMNRRFCFCPVRPVQTVADLSAPLASSYIDSLNRRSSNLMYTDREAEEKGKKGR